MPRILQAAIVLAIAALIALNFVGPAESRTVPLAQVLEWMRAAQKPGVSAKTRTALLDAAIQALRRVLARNPSLVRARLELARAFFLKGEDRLARLHFERALAGNLPAVVQARVRRYLNAIRARRNWSLRGGLAIAPDTNIGASSDSEIVWLPAFGTVLPFRVNESARPSSGLGLVAWGGAEYQHPISQRWRLRLGADATLHEYPEVRFDLLRLGGHAGPRWLIGRTTEASLLATVAQQWRGNRKDYSEIGLRLEVSQRLSRALWLYPHIAWTLRTYEESGHVNGDRWRAGLALRWQALPTLRLDLRGLASAEETRLASYRSVTGSAGIGAHWLLPWGFTLGGSADLSWTGYNPGWAWITRGPDRRKDAAQVYRMTLLHRSFTLSGFSPQLLVTREARRSNAQLYGYRRWRGEVRLLRQF